MTTDPIAAARALLEPLTGYTTGPWKAWQPRHDESVPVRTDGLGITIAYVHQGAVTSAHNNARLIAAAPDLRDTVATLADSLEAERAKVAAARLEGWRAGRDAVRAEMKGTPMTDDTDALRALDQDDLIALNEGVMHAEMMEAEKVQMDTPDARLLIEAAREAICLRAEVDQALAQLAAVQRETVERCAQELEHHHTCEADSTLCTIWQERIRALPIDPEAEAALKRHDAALIERISGEIEVLIDAAGRVDLCERREGLRDALDAIRALARPTEGEQDAS